MFMPDENETRNEVLDNTEVSDTTQDYISAINELKKNSVERSKYDQLLAENKELIQNLVNGQTMDTQVQKQPVDIQKLRNELFSGEVELNNLQYVSKALELRDAILEQERRRYLCRQR